MVLFMMKSYLLDIKIDSQPLLFLRGILKGVSVETPETPLDLPLNSCLESVAGNLGFRFFLFCLFFIKV